MGNKGQLRSAECGVRSAECGTCCGQGCPRSDGVAQVSGPAVSRVSKPADAQTAGAPRAFSNSADWEVGDTAGLETCATLACVNRSASMEFSICQRASRRCAAKQFNAPISARVRISCLLNPVRSLKSLSEA